MQKNILDYNLKELTEIVSELGEKSFRAKQIYGWLAKGASDWHEMSNVPLKLREKLTDDYYIGQPQIVLRQESSDGTIKCLYEFPDGARVESVFMKYEYGNSICISSQVGCRMGCSFCASTISGLERNLSAGEMLGEVLAMARLANGGNLLSAGSDAGKGNSGRQCTSGGSGAKIINHIVIMGMGEPLDNYDGVSKFLRLIHDEDGYNLSYRNITLSTCGLVPMIERFGDDFPQVNLAVSLHASNDTKRREIMPVAGKYDFDSLLAACRRYTEKTGRRISFEYSMINGVNDSADNARELAGALRGWLTHVNLIPLNKVEERSYEASAGRNIVAFRDILEKSGVACTIRRTLGSDIDAACGQLRSRNSL